MGGVCAQPQSGPTLLYLILRSAISDFKTHLSRSDESISYSRFLMEEEQKFPKFLCAHQLQLRRFLATCLFQMCLVGVGAGATGFFSCR